jgi:hypothetical protein
MPEICRAWFEKNENQSKLLLMAELYERRRGFYKRSIGSANRQLTSEGSWRKWDVSFVAMHGEKMGNDTLMIGSYDTQEQAREALYNALFAATMLNTQLSLAETKKR